MQNFHVADMHGNEPHTEQKNKNSERTPVPDSRAAILQGC